MKKSTQLTHCFSFRTFTLSAILALLVAVPAVQAESQAATENQHEGLRLIEEACIQCHDLYPIFSQRKPAAAWEETISIMNWKGTQLLPGEAEKMLDYLVSSFSPDSGFPLVSAHSISGDVLPEGAGKSLVLEKCIACHDLSLVFGQRKSRAGWTESTDWMILLGTQLNDRQREIVIDYLTSAFGN